MALKVIFFVPLQTTLFSKVAALVLSMTRSTEFPMRFVLASHVEPDPEVVVVFVKVSSSLMKSPSVPGQPLVPIWYGP